MGETLVLGTAFGYGAQHVRIFVESLRRHYDGDVQLVVTSRGPADLLDYLPTRRVVPRFFDTALWMVTHIQVGRYVRYYEILRESPKRYDRVLLTDVTDVMFQGDPFHGAPDGDLLFFMEDPRTTIGASKPNATWIQQVFGDETLGQLADKPISCSGTTMGSHDAVLHYIELLLKYAKPDLMASLKGWKGHDQGIHNYLLHTGAVPARMVENGTHIHTLGLMPDADIRIGTDGILGPHGRPCPIVHQWNYRPAAKAWVEKSWAAPGN
ncbi:MAG: hypothetical protein ACM31L_02315 [Actinomycetota bacterium]